MAQFPEPKSLNVLEIGDGMDHSTQKYDLSNPHPGYGKDPNIINQFGHTVYPKWVNGQIANNADEEAAITGNKVEAPTAKPTDNGWSE